MAADDVPQVLHLRLQESALGGFELQTGTSESFENLPQTTDVSLEVKSGVITMTSSRYISSVFQVEPTEDLFHEPLEGGGGGGQPKGQHLPLPQSVPRDERRLLLGFKTQRDLPIAAQQV